MTDGRRILPHGSHWGAFGVEVADGRVVATRPFAGDPEPSRLAASVPDAVHHRARIAGPMVRRGWLERRDTAGRGRDGYVPVPWDRVVGIVAGEIDRVRREFGNASIFGGSYGWASAGRFHHAKSQLQRFLNMAGGFTSQLHNYSYAAGLAVLPHIVGGVEAVAGPVTDWDTIVANTGLMVAFGGVPLKNSEVDSGGTAIHPSGGYARAAGDAGVRFIVVSPLRDDVPDGVDAEWIAIRPGSDTAMMLALMQVMVDEGLHDADFLARYCTGFGSFAPYLADKTPEWAAALTGVPAERIRRLAREMSAVRTMISTAWALQRGDHGEQPFWATVALAACLGQIGLPGGGFGFGYGCVAGMGVRRHAVTGPTLPLGRNPTGSFIPVARIADMLLDPGGGYDFDGERRIFPDIRLVHWAGGNPFHHHQDINRLIEAFRRPETVIVHDPWWTATARHADIVIPATTTLERNDICSGRRDRYWLAMHRAIDPVDGARNDHDVFADLADALGFGEAFTEGRGEMDWLRHIYDVARQNAAGHGATLPDFDRFWAEGHVEIPRPGRLHVLFEEFRRGGAPLDTPSGRIELFSERVAGFGYEDCPGYPAWLPPKEWLGAEEARRWPLHLISNQPAWRLHSQLDHGRVAQGNKVAGREPVRLHPDDAAARGIRGGDVVRIFNDRGSVLAGAVLSSDVMRGVVQLATGAWYDPVDPHAVGSMDKHGNPNVLTGDRGTSRLGQGPSPLSALVEVERHEGRAPAVTAFDPPEIAA